MQGHGKSVLELELCPNTSESIFWCACSCSCTSCRCMEGVDVGKLFASRTSTCSDNADGFVQALPTFVGLFLPVATIVASFLCTDSGILTATCLATYVTTLLSQIWMESAFVKRGEPTNSQEIVLMKTKGQLQCSAGALNCLKQCVATATVSSWDEREVQSGS